jgi:hypothetical protein
MDIAKLAGVDAVKLVVMIVQAVADPGRKG